MMNKQEILKKIKKYNLPKDDFVIISGAAMVFHGLKDTTNDLDVTVKPSLEKFLRDNYNTRLDWYDESTNKGIYYLNDELNFSSNLKEIFDNKEYSIINGYKVQNIDSIIKLKQKLNREKDQKDLHLLNNQLNITNSLTLAYLGDSIYEIYIRKYLIDEGIVKVKDLQKEATNYVSAKGQAHYLTMLLDNNLLSEEEVKVVYRARNHKSHKSPKNTDIITYKYATGLEALMGYLYLKQDFKRLNEIMNYIMGRDICTYLEKMSPKNI